LQPRERRKPKGGEAELVMAQRRQQTGAGRRSAPGLPRGMEEGMWRQPGVEQERPYSTADVRRSGSDKPMVKRDRVERESEGLVVPLMVRRQTHRREGALL